MYPATLLARFRPHLAGRLPESERAVGDHQLGLRVEAAPLEIEQKIAPVVGTFPCAIGESDKLLLAFRRRPDEDEDALLLT